MHLLLLPEKGSQNNSENFANNAAEKPKHSNFGQPYPMTLGGVGLGEIVVLPYKAQLH